MASHHPRRRRSEAEREERREGHRRQLTEAVEALLSSEGWARWVRARARNGLSNEVLTVEVDTELLNGPIADTPCAGLG